MKGSRRESAMRRRALGETPLNPHVRHSEAEGRKVSPGWDDDGLSLALKATARKRFLRALAVVVALLLMVPVIDALLKATAPPPQEAAAVAAGLDSRAFVRADDPFATLDRLEGLADAGSGEVSEAVSREIGFLPGARDVRADATGSVIGYIVEADAAEAFDCLADHMESRGWTAVRLGGVDGATFVKRDGSCRWALATCTQVGQWTSVVVRCIFP